MSRWGIGAFSLTLLADGLWTTPILATTWKVDSGQPGIQSIQSAIDSAQTGDIILVAPGLYDESIDFRGKSVRLISTGGAESTIIDGGNRQKPVVSFISGESQQAELDGFTIQHGLGYQSGSGSLPASGGGGVFIYDSEPIVRSNIIQFNKAENALGGGAGGGIYCSGTPGIQPIVWRPEISGNIIRLNEARTQGGGIYVVNVVAPLIKDNIIEDNAVEGDGGGISLRVIVPGGRTIGNRIIRNTAGDHAGGIVVATASNDVTQTEVSWNLLYDNIAGHESPTPECGAAIWVGGIDAWVHHNTIVANECQDGLGGGGISIISNGTPLIERNIIAMTKTGGAVFCGRGGSADIRDNIFWNNPPLDELTCGSLAATNIFEDPMFCNPMTGNFQVAADSPALNLPLSPIGAFQDAGCQQVPVRSTTWGRMKGMYGSAR